MAPKRDMGLLFKASLALAAAAWFPGTGPFSAPSGPRASRPGSGRSWAAARPQERLAAQLHKPCFVPGRPTKPSER